jgi:LemA protein
MMTLTWFYIATLVVVVWLIWTYNRLVTLRYRAKEALSDIDVQLKRRFDLIPNLVESVKGYMAHEKSVLENVTAARASVASAKGNPLEREEAENALSSTLKTLFAVAENYPDLKANANFLDLQRELADTENKIQASRRFYNSTVRDLNTKIETIPVKFVAAMFGFKPEPFFRAEDSEREPVKVKF